MINISQIQVHYTYVISIKSTLHVIKILINTNIVAIQKMRKVFSEHNWEKKKRTVSEEVNNLSLGRYPMSKIDLVGFHAEYGDFVRIERPRGSRFPHQPTANLDPASLNKSTHLRQID